MWNVNLFKTYGMGKKGWVLVDPGSVSGLDSAVAKASEREQLVLGQYQGVFLHEHRDALKVRICHCHLLGE